MLDGQKLIPSVTRVFSKSRDLYVFLQAYERSAANAQPVVAFLSLYEGQTKAFETQPIAVTNGLNKIENGASALQRRSQSDSRGPV